MDKFSQQAAPLLSNPATNPFDEIPLNGEGDGVDPDEMKSAQEIVRVILSQKIW